MAVERALPALVPIIIRLFPSLVNIRLVRGLLIPLKSVSEASETDLARQLARKLKLDERTKFRDTAHVVKVSDVKACYENTMKDGALLLQFLKALCQSLTDPKAKNAAEAIGDKLMTCVRDKALTQKAARKRITYRYSKRQI
jgi:hypothetical protein